MEATLSLHRPLRDLSNFINSFQNIACLQETNYDHLDHLDYKENSDFTVQNQDQLILQ